MKVLSDKQKEEIIKMYATGGYTMKQLAKQFYVSPSTIWRILPKDKNKRRQSNLKILMPTRNKESVSKKYNRDKEVDKLIQVVWDFALVDNWTDLYLMQILLSCGLTKTDFENAGCVDFYNETIKMIYDKNN